MPLTPGNINQARFTANLTAFKTFVAEKSGMPFTAFGSNPYTRAEEGYKTTVFHAARSALAWQNWTKADIGTGFIADAVIKAIELRENNLVTWQARYGAAQRPHQALYLAKENPQSLNDIETTLFELYHGNRDGECFTDLVAFFGRKYALLAYLFFIKDKANYLPIAPRYFDQAFEMLGADVKTTGRCSWDNYSDYLAVIEEIRQLLEADLQTPVTLLDAHSFTWVIVRQMQAPKAADTDGEEE